MNIESTVEEVTNIRTIQKYRHPFNLNRRCGKTIPFHCSIKDFLELSEESSQYIEECNLFNVVGNERIFNSERVNSYKEIINYLKMCRGLKDIVLGEVTGCVTSELFHEINTDYEKGVPIKLPQPYLYDSPHIEDGKCNQKIYMIYWKLDSECLRRYKHIMLIDWGDISPVSIMCKTYIPQHLFCEKVKNKELIVNQMKKISLNGDKNLTLLKDRLSYIDFQNETS